MLRTRYFTLVVLILLTVTGFAKTISVQTLADLQRSVQVPKITVNIKKSIDLCGSTIVIPDGVVIKVNSKLSNGKIEGNNTQIEVGKKGKFSNIAFNGSYNVPSITYKNFDGYLSDTELLRAMLDLTFKNIAHSTLQLEPKRIYDIEYHKLAYAHAIYEYENVSNKTIVGCDAIISDKRTNAHIGFENFDGVFLFSACHGISIQNLHYQNLDEEYPEIRNENGSVKVGAGIEKQLGYIGASFVLLQNDCSRINISSNIIGARYGIKSGDYSKFWLCGDYGVKNSSFNINAKRTGYPVAIEIGDSLNINVTSDTHHRACYLCGISNSTINIQAKNIMIAPLHCLLSDTHYSKGDPKKPQFKACYGLDINFVELGSEIATAGDVYCVGLQTYNTVPFQKRKASLEWHDIRIKIKKESSAPKVGLFNLMRMPTSNTDALSIRDTYRNIVVLAEDPFSSDQWSMRLLVSDVADYQDVKLNIKAKNGRIIYDNANKYSFDLSDSSIGTLFYTGNITLDKNEIKSIVEHRSVIQAKGHNITNKSNRK